MHLPPAVRLRRRRTRGPGGPCAPDADDLSDEDCVGVGWVEDDDSGHPWSLSLVQRFTTSRWVSLMTISDPGGACSAALLAAHAARWGAMWVGRWGGDLNAQRNVGQFHWSASIHVQRKKASNSVKRHLCHHAMVAQAAAAMPGAFRRATARAACCLSCHGAWTGSHASARSAQSR